MMINRYWNHGAFGNQPEAEELLGNQVEEDMLDFTRIVRKLGIRERIIQSFCKQPTTPGYPWCILWVFLNIKKKGRGICWVQFAVHRLYRIAGSHLNLHPKSVGNSLANTSGGVRDSAVDDKVQVVKMELCEDVEDGFHGLEVFQHSYEFSNM